MKAVKFYTRAIAAGFMKVGRITVELARSRLRMLLGAAVVVAAVHTAMAVSDAEAEAGILPVVGVQVPPGYTGIGPVELGPVDFGSIPSKSRRFLRKNCAGQAVVRCSKRFVSGDYEISLADGIDMEFDAGGNIIGIEAPDGYSLSPGLLRAVVPGKLYRLLERNGFRQSVESVRHDGDGYRLEVSDPAFGSVSYDSSGVLTLVMVR